MIQLAWTTFIPHYQENCIVVTDYDSSSLDYDTNDILNLEISLFTRTHTSDIPTNTELCYDALSFVYYCFAKKV